MPRLQRKDFVNAVLAIERTAFTPVQIQKLFFLIDRQLGERLDGTYFDFEPYDYGPFDKAVYHEIDALKTDGFADAIYTSPTFRHYVLTEEGRQRGGDLLQTIDLKLVELIRERIQFIKGLSFTQLISSIYKAYPEMKENSVFQ